MGAKIGPKAELRILLGIKARATAKTLLTLTIQCIRMTRLDQHNASLTWALFTSALDERPSQKQENID